MGIVADNAARTVDRTMRRDYDPVGEIVIGRRHRRCHATMHAEAYVACLVHVAGDRDLVFDARSGVESDLRLDRVVIGIVVGSDFRQRANRRPPVDGENGVEIAAKRIDGDRPRRSRRITPPHAVERTVLAGMDRLAALCSSADIRASDRPRAAYSRERHRDPVNEVVVCRPGWRWWRRSTAEHDARIVDVNTRLHHPGRGNTLAGRFERVLDQVDRGVGEGVAQRRERTRNVRRRH